MDNEQTQTHVKKYEMDETILNFSCVPSSYLMLYYIIQKNASCMAVERPTFSSYK